MKRSLLFALSCFAWGNFILSNSASAQITTDGTTNTTVNSDSDGNFTIEQGDRAGSNLFHSFDDFSVPTNGSATFNNATDISNIFSRVTGGNISNIDGLIGANGSANLFLINPAGILFSNNARLDIGGSFFGTTADSILFEDGEFSATNLDNPLLTINAPIGLNFRERSGDISVTGTENAIEPAEFALLSVVEDGNLSLIGGNVNLNNALLLAPGGKIQVGGLSAAGTINLDRSGNFTFPEAVSKANVSLNNSQALANFSSDGEGGSINIDANNIELANASVLQSGIDADLGFAEAQSGDINLDATSAINIRQSSNIFNRVEPNAVGNTGDITLNTTDLSLLDGSQIVAEVFGTGNVGNIAINALRDTTVRGVSSSGLPSGIANNVAFGGSGNAGNIQVNTANLNLTDGGGIVSNAVGMGSAGNITINVDSAANISGFTIVDESTIRISRISSQIGPGVEGNAGDIRIDAGSLTINDSGVITNSTLGQGDAGNITVNVENAVNLTNNAQILSIVEAGAVGNSGRIDLTTTDLLLTQGGQINAGTFGQGDAGAISINATGNVSASGEDSAGLPSGISSAVNPEAVGNSGGIDLTTTNLTLTGGSQINASTFGQGDAGAITINADGDISASGEDLAGLPSGISSAVNPSAVGNSGGIDLTTTNLTLTGGSQINASTLGQGDAGAIAISADGDIFVDGENSAGLLSSISSAVGETAVGDSGGINITAARLALTQGGQINGSTVGRGNAGTVIVNASGDILIDGENLTGFSSTIGSAVGETAVGDSGGINITARDITLTRGGAINGATFGQGDAGAIAISADGDISVDGENLAGLPSSISNSVNPEAVGNSGGIDLTTTNLLLTQGGQINASTLGQGDAGAIAIDATGNISAKGISSIGFISGLFSIVQPTGNGNAGGIDLNTNNLVLNNAGISVSSLGQGNADNLTIISNSLALSNNAFLAASTPVGTGGNIDLQIADRITLEDETDIAASAFGNANGGNLTINTNLIVAFPGDNDIIADAEQGQGGVVTIDAESLLGIEERLLNDATNDINASSENSTLDGDVFINTSDVNLTQKTAELPSNTVEAEQVVSTACAGRDIGTASSFVVKGRGGLPTLSTAPLSSEIITVDGELEANTNNNAIATGIGKITLARGVIKTADGKIILTSIPVKSNATRTANGSPNCS